MRVDLRVVGRERGGDRDDLLGGRRVARRRGDRDERLEVAFGARGERAGVLLDPRVRHIRTLAAMAKGPQVGEPAPDFELPGTTGPFKLSDHRGARVVLLFYPGDNTPGVHEAVLLVPRPARRRWPSSTPSSSGSPHQDLASHEDFTRQAQPDGAAAGRHRQGASRSSTASRRRCSARAAPRS